MNKLKIIGSGFALCIMFVAGWEGLWTSAYLDTGGVPTICYGHTEGVSIGDTATKKECRELLKKELKVYWDWVDKYVTVPMEPWQQIALASFTYNVGTRAFANSTLLKLANQGKWTAACAELLRWVYDNGRKIGGLVNRRESEFRMCIGEGVTK